MNRWPCYFCLLFIANKGNSFNSLRVAILINLITAYAKLLFVEAVQGVFAILKLVVLLY